jgi:predicted acetyltransferase
MREIFEELRKRDIPLAFLVPQKDGLFEYYKRFGFADVFTLCFDKLVRDKLPQDKVLQSYELIRSNLTESVKSDGSSVGESPADCDIAEVNGLFEKVMKYRNHLKRTPEHWRRSVKDGEIAGGGMFLLKAGGVFHGYALCEWVGEDLLINELLAEDEASYNTLCAGVLDRMGAKEASMLAAACPHDAKRFGMARVLDAEKMLGYAAAYRGGMDCDFDLQDNQAVWNNGRYEISEKTVRRVESAGSKAYITPEQLTEILFGAGPLPYINLLFS